MNPFQSLRDYEEFVYTLRQQFPSIQGSALVIVQRGKRMATLQGEITFAQGYRITLKERLSLDEGPVVIEDYGYEFWHKGDKVTWYDAQPHPDEPILTKSYPHHQHVPCDMKHHRIPAPKMSFTQPNLPALIREIEKMLKEGLFPESNRNVG
ncbi:MAG: hypothetical protein DDT28_00673 [Dehalococcoidia bacterium]|nr:hypothetical protein [Chloroflexota bacterium]